MATVYMNGVDQIGEVAGQVWHCLADSGPLSNSKVAKGIDAPRDLVMQAIGWLAREGKICIEESARGKVIRLTNPK